MSIRRRDTEADADEHWFRRRGKQLGTSIEAGLKQLRRKNDAVMVYFERIIPFKPVTFSLTCGSPPVLTILELPKLVSARTTLRIKWDLFQQDYDLKVQYHSILEGKAHNWWIVLSFNNWSRIRKMEPHDGSDSGLKRSVCLIMNCFRFGWSNQQSSSRKSWSVSLITSLLNQCSLSNQTLEAFKLVTWARLKVCGSDNDVVVFFLSFCGRATKKL